MNNSFSYAIIVKSTYLNLIKFQISIILTPFVAHKLWLRSFSFTYCHHNVSLNGDKQGVSTYVYQSRILGPIIINLENENDRVRDQQISNPPPVVALGLFLHTFILKRSIGKSLCSYQIRLAASFIVILIFIDIDEANRYLDQSRLEQAKTILMDIIVDLQSNLSVTTAFKTILKIWWNSYEVATFIPEVLVKSVI